MALVNIPGELYSKATGNKVADASNIKDSSSNGYSNLGITKTDATQKEINKAINDKIKSCSCTAATEQQITDMLTSIGI